MSRSKTHAAVVTIIMVLLSSVFFLSCTKNAEKKGMEVRLTTSKNVWCSLSLLADAKGYYKDEGLDVDLSFTDGGRYCMDALLSNSADAGMIVETNVSYLGYQENKTIAVVANVVRSTSIAIVGRRSSGINEISDLVGKRLGLVPAMQGEIFAHRVLEKHNVAIDSVQIQKLQPKAITPALDKGAIDAASTWEPFVYACTRALGDDAVVFRDPEAHKGYMHLAVRRDWAKQNPEIVNALLRALRKADEFAATNPEEAQKILSPIMNVDLEIVRAIWPHFEIHLEFDPQEVLQAIVAEGEWVKTTQEDFKSKELPDYSGYIDSTYYNEMK